MDATKTDTLTTANTVTLARSELLGVQMGVIMRRLTEKPKDYIDKMKDCLKQQKIERLIICVYTPAGECIGQLFFIVDWEEHKLQIAANGGSDLVVIKNKYRDSFPETEEVTEVMEGLLDRYGGYSDFFVTPSHKYHDEVCETLDLIPGTLPEVSGETAVSDINVRELKELRYTLKIGEASVNARGQ